MLDLLANAPSAQPPPYVALVSELRGACSRRKNLEHRPVFQVQADIRIVKMLSLWSHHNST